jgi:hypothetical protein
MKNVFTTLSKMLLAGGLALSVSLALSLTGCDKKQADHSADDGHDRGNATNATGAGEDNEGTAAPSNRVDIPASVRQNLGITLAKVESRNVAQTLRVPGRFEFLPTARREYRTPHSGRVDVLVSQYQRSKPARRSIESMPRVGTICMSKSRQCRLASTRWAHFGSRTAGMSRASLASERRTLRSSPYTLIAIADRPDHGLATPRRRRRDGASARSCG